MAASPEEVPVKQQAKAIPSIITARPGGIASTPALALDGRGRLVGGMDWIRFPESFAAAGVEPGEAHVQLTAVGRPLDLYVGTIDAHGFEVRGVSDGEFFWTLH